MGELGCLWNDIWASWGVYGMTFGRVGVVYGMKIWASWGVYGMTFGRVRNGLRNDIWASWAVYGMTFGRVGVSTVSTE